MVFWPNFIKGDYLLLYRFSQLPVTCLNSLLVWHKTHNYHRLGRVLQINASHFNKNGWQRIFFAKGFLHSNFHLQHFFAKTSIFLIVKKLFFKLIFQISNQTAVIVAPSFFAQKTANSWQFAHLACKIIGNMLYTCSGKKWECSEQVT